MYNATVTTSFVKTDMVFCSVKLMQAVQVPVWSQWPACNDRWMPPLVENSSSWMTCWAVGSVFVFLIFTSTVKSSEILYYIITSVLNSPNLSQKHTKIRVYLYCDMLGSASYHAWTCHKQTNRYIEKERERERERLDVYLFIYIYTHVYTNTKTYHDIWDSGFCSSVCYRTIISPK